MLKRDDINEKIILNSKRAKFWLFALLFYQENVVYHKNSVVRHKKLENIRRIRYCVPTKNMRHNKGGYIMWGDNWLFS